MNMSSSEIERLLTTSDPGAVEELFSEARRVRDAVYGRKVFMRGLIEITNHCRNNCRYCGIRRDAAVQRYRLTKEEIMECCRVGHGLGFRTFVMQGGEDGWYSDERMCDIVRSVKRAYPDCAVTLSLGERGRESFRRLREAGADRYLLRHETADREHYALLHPAEMRFDHRMQCLRDLRELGYQVGCGFMVGSPHQTLECLMKDLRFIEEFRPEMVGIGPFIPATGTPFEKERAGSLELTIRLLAIIRIMHPHVLLPATSALGTMHPTGRERAVHAGANVVMPNLSPQETRSLYLIYNNKLSTGSEAAESVADIRARMKAIGYEVPTDRGDYMKETIE